jgi:hypothetical protein
MSRTYVNFQTAESRLPHCEPSFSVSNRLCMIRSLRIRGVQIPIGLSFGIFVRPILRVTMVIILSMIDMETGSMNYAPKVNDFIFLAGSWFTKYEVVAVARKRRLW